MDDIFSERFPLGCPHCGDWLSCNVRYDHHMHRHILSCGICGFKKVSRTNQMLSDFFEDLKQYAVLSSPKSN